MREVAERVYTLHYPEFYPHLHEEMPEASCREVMDILDMHWSLKSSYLQLTDKAGIDEEQIRFDGFDGNNEAQYLAYAQFLIKQDRWPELKDEVKNSHAQTLHYY